MGARPVTNAAILERTLRRLRRDGRLDELAEMLAVLAGASARLVDATCTPDSGVAAYAQAASLRAHMAVLAELSGRIAPVSTDEEDPWERIAAELEASSAEAFPT